MSSFSDFIKKLNDLCDSEMESKRKESEKTKEIERKEEEKRRKEELAELEKKIKEQQKEMENQKKMLEKKNAEIQKREGKLKEDLKKRREETLKEKERKMEEMLKQINDNKKHLEENKQKELKRMQRLESAKKSLYNKEKKFVKPGQEISGKEQPLQEEDDLPNINNSDSQGTNQMDILQKLKNQLSSQQTEGGDNDEYYNDDPDEDAENDDGSLDDEDPNPDPESFDYGDDDEDEDDENIDDEDMEDPDLDPDFDLDSDQDDGDQDDDYVDDEDELDKDKTEEERLFNKSEDEYHTDATQDSEGYDEIQDEDEDGDNDKYSDADEDEETNEDVEPEAVDNNDHQDDDDDDVMSKISKFLKGDSGSKVIIIRQSSSGMGDGMESEPIMPSCPIRGEEEPETNMFPCCEQDEEMNSEDDTEETEDGVDNTDQDINGEVGASSEDINPDAEEQIKDYIANTPDLKVDEFNDFISDLGVSHEQAMEILFKQIKSGGESENIESSPEDNMGDEEDPEQNDQEEMSPSYESLDILEKLKKKLLEQPNDPMMGGMPGGMSGGMVGGLPGGQPPLPPEMGPGGPDAEMAGENPEEDQEDAMPIELETKTEELKQSGFEVENNNSYDYYDKIRRRLNDDESINALNNLYSEIPESKRHITPAKYLYDRVLNAIKKKRKDLAAGGAMGQQGIGGMAGGMGGGMSPMGASNVATSGPADMTGGSGEISQGPSL